MGKVSRSTRAKAAASIKPITGIIGAKVLKEIQTAPSGLTSDEAEQRLGLSHQTCSARFNELAAKNLIEENGSRRPTRSGRQAAVWSVTVQGKLAIGKLAIGKLFPTPTGDVEPRGKITRTPVLSQAAS